MTPEEEENFWERLQAVEIKNQMLTVRVNKLEQIWIDLTSILKGEQD